MNDINRLRKLYHSRRATRQERAAYLQFLISQDPGEMTDEESLKLWEQAPELTAEEQTGQCEVLYRLQLRILQGRFGPIIKLLYPWIDSNPKSPWW